MEKTCDGKVPVAAVVADDLGAVDLDVAGEVHGQVLIEEESSRQPLVGGASVDGCLLLTLEPARHAPSADEPVELAQRRLGGGHHLFLRVLRGLAHGSDSLVSVVTAGRSPLAMSLVAPWDRKIGQVADNRRAP